MFDAMAKSSQIADAGEVDGSRPVLDENSSAQKVAERLREAVKSAGGHGAVAARSGIKSRTLSTLLAGQEAKQGQLVALADACRVSVEWLATGRGEPNFGWATLEMNAQTPDGP